MESIINVSSSTVKRKATNQSSIISESCKSSTTWLQHHDKIKNELSEQLNIINENDDIILNHGAIDEIILIHLIYSFGSLSWL